MAQLLARVDLWAGIYRLKGLAETGQPDHRTDGLISAGVAIVTGLMTFVAFGLWQGWVIAGILVLALFVHELGHLIAFKLIGQPWGRVVFLPFLGALAMPRLPYHLQAESIFAALMGPGFSLVIPGAVALDLLWDGTAHPLVLIIGVITTALNLFNLLPVEPLDGGVALRSIMGKLFGSRANYGLCAIGAVMMIVGWFLKEPLLLVFGGISILANWKPRRIDPGLVPLSNLQCCISIFGFVALATSYIAIWELLVSHV
jgi:Zn-dependent protease